MLRRGRQPIRTTAANAPTDLLLLVESAAGAVEACRADVELLLDSLGVRSPQRLLLQSIHDRLAAVVLTLTAERRAPEPDIEVVDSSAANARRVLVAVLAAAAALGSVAETSGFSIRDMVGSVRASADTADECLHEVRIVGALIRGESDLGLAELRQLIEHASLLTDARLRELELEGQPPSLSSGLDRVLLGYRREVTTKPSYIRAQLAEALDRIKHLETHLGVSATLGARKAIDSALDHPGPTGHITALQATLRDLAAKVE